MTPPSVVTAVEDRLFSAPDAVCLDRARLVTEAWARHEDDPPPLRAARVLAHLLGHLTLDVRSNPVLLGNTSSAPGAWMLVPEFGLGVDLQVAIEHPRLAGFLDERVPADLRAFWRDRSFGPGPGGCAGLGHFSVDFDLVVNRGLEDVLARIEAYRDHGDAAARLQREAMAIGCRAVLAWARRLADEAGRAAADPATPPDDAACLRRAAAACRHVPARPARNLLEGLQAIALVHLATVLEGQGMSLSVGLPDRALARFSAEAEADPEEAATLVRAFLLKIAANSYQGRGSKTQAVTVGGAAFDAASPESPRDACHAVTRAFLEAFDRSPVNDPHLFVRWHEALDPRVWEKALAMLARGRSMPLLANDHAVVPGLLAAGVAPADAWDWAVVGCNELGLPGRCALSGVSLGVGFNDLAVLDHVLRAAPPGPADVEALLGAWETRIHELTTEGVARLRALVGRHAAERPFPFLSACCRGCVESGRDYLRGLPYPDLHGLFLRGTSNAVNALAAVEALCAGGGPTPWGPCSTASTPAIPPSWPPSTTRPSGATTTRAPTGWPWS